MIPPSKRVQAVEKLILKKSEDSLRLTTRFLVGRAVTKSN